MTFVKSGSTRVPVGNSRAEIEKMLRRYGAVGFNVQQTFTPSGISETIAIQFIVPDKPGSKARVPVALPVNVRDVAIALFGKGYEISREQWEMAERVAWRNLVLWIDAALSATSIGLQTITEAFYAHTVIRLEDGTQSRLSAYIEREQAHLAPGIRALLTPPPKEK